MPIRISVFVIGFGLSLALAAGCGQSEPTVRFRITSASMAPKWLGPSREVTCLRCGERIKASLTSSDFSRPLKCDLCDGDCSVSSDVLPGEVVEVKPIPPGELASYVRRLSCIVYQQNDQRVVKRVWGLPGERVQFIDGEVWLNGCMYNKTMDELCKVAVPVASVSPAKRLGLNLQPGEGSGPVSRDSGHSPTSIALAAGCTLQWTPVVPRTLEQTLVRNTISNNTIGRRYGVSDDYRNSPGLPRSLRLVGDYVVEFQFDGESKAILEVYLRSREDTIGIELLKLAKPSELLTEEARQFPVHRRVRVAICDGRFLIAGDLPSNQGEFPLDQVTIHDSEVEMDVDGRPLLEIKVQSGMCELQHVSIARDLYLRKSDRIDEQDSDFGIVPEDHLFVLGDNLPVSLDSRNSAGFIPFEQVAGTVVGELE